MNGLAHIECHNNRLIVSGDLSFMSVMHVWKQSLPLLNDVAEWRFDLSAVKSCNSAGLALLVEWVKLARKSDKIIHFNNMPAQLLSIARVSNVLGVLGVG